MATAKVVKPKQPPKPASPQGAKQRVVALERAGVPVPDCVRDLAQDVEVMKARSDRLVKSGHASELALHYVAVKQYREALESIAAALTIERDRLAYLLIPEAFDAEKATTITLEAGFRVTISAFIRASVKEDQREKAKEWLRKHGHGDLIIETINAATLSAFAREMADEGRELPESIFTTNVGRNTSVTKVVPK